jgi:hypothetical protein
MFLFVIGEFVILWSLVLGNWSFLLAPKRILLYTFSVPAFGGQWMNLADLKARVRRLDQLSRGLAKEVTLWKACNDPLLYLERKAYLHAIQDALAGVEAARVVLVKVYQRLETSAPPARRRGEEGVGPAAVGRPGAPQA